MYDETYNEEMGECERVSVEENEVECDDYETYNAVTGKCEFIRGISKRECNKRKRSWISGTCSKQCQIRGSRFDKKTETCVVDKKCSSGFSWDKKRVRCVPDYLKSFSRAECAQAGLYWLRKNNKKGRIFNGCYARCRTKAFVFNKRQGTCQQAAQYSLVKKECKKLNRRFSNTRQLCTQTCRPST